MDQPSGRFVLRVPPDLHRRLREGAADAGVSLNRHCVDLLEAATTRTAQGALPAAPEVPAALLDSAERAWGGDLLGVVLFGSAARGAAREDSDVDLLLVLQSGVPVVRDLYRRWDGLVKRGTEEAGHAISPQFVALPASVERAGGIWLEVAREGIVLRDRSRTISRFLTALRDRIASGAMTRRETHGQPYWVREPRRR